MRKWEVIRQSTLLVPTLASYTRVLLEQSDTSLLVQELAKAFKTDVNSLPLSLDISWFEQKAVAVLLTLVGPKWEVA